MESSWDIFGGRPVRKTGDLLRVGKAVAASWGSSALVQRQRVDQQSFRVWKGLQILPDYPNPKPETLQLTP